MLAEATAVIQAFLSSVGAAVFVPVIMIIMGMIVGMKFKDAFSAGLLLGVAFTGMSMLIGFMSGIMQPVGEAMLTTSASTSRFSMAAGRPCPPFHGPGLSRSLCSR